MNNIYFLLCCLVFITFSTLAEEVVNDVCSEYSWVSGNPDIYSTLSDEIPYRKGLLWKIENTSGDISYLFGNPGNLGKITEFIKTADPDIVGYQYLAKNFCTCVNLTTISIAAGN